MTLHLVNTEKDLTRALEHYIYMHSGLWIGRKDFDLENIRANLISMVDKAILESRIAP